MKTHKTTLVYTNIKKFQGNFIMHFVRLSHLWGYINNNLTSIESLLFTMLITN